MSVVGLWPDGWMDQDATSYGLGLGQGHIVLHVDPAPPPRKGHSSPLQFAAHVCCGQTAGWIKMPLGRKVDLRPGGIMLHGDPKK